LSCAACEKAVARRNERNLLSAFSFYQAFSFAPFESKEKADKGHISLSKAAFCLHLDKACGLWYNGYGYIIITYTGGCMNIDCEKLKYLLNDMDLRIGELIDNVLNDSDSDPHFSAVAAVNKIKCYIQIMNDLGEKLPYDTVEEFFEFNAYTKDEYRRFEELRQKESQHYRDVQY
jgi:hypothetical protein